MHLLLCSTWCSGKLHINHIFKNWFRLSVHRNSIRNLTAHFVCNLELKQLLWALFSSSCFWKYTSFYKLRMKITEEFLRKITSQTSYLLIRSKYRLGQWLSSDFDHDLQKKKKKKYILLSIKIHTYIYSYSHIGYIYI